MSEPKKIETGGLAFPNSNRTFHDGSRGMFIECASVDGMTLRDYFAAKALQAIIPDLDSQIQEDVKLAYEYADAMIKASKV